MFISCKMLFYSCLRSYLAFFWFSYNVDFFLSLVFIGQSLYICNNCIFSSFCDSQFVYFISLVRACVYHYEHFFQSHMVFRIWSSFVFLFVFSKSSTAFSFFYNVFFSLLHYLAAISFCFSLDFFANICFMILTHSYSSLIFRIKYFLFRFFFFFTRRFYSFIFYSFIFRT